MRFAILILFFVFVAAFGVFLSNAGRGETIWVKFLWWSVFEGPYPNGIALALLAGALLVWIPMALQSMFLGGRIGWLKRQLAHGHRSATAKAPGAEGPRARPEDEPTPRT